MFLIIEWVTFSVVALLLIFKLFELSKANLWAYEHGSNFANDLSQAVRKWKQTTYDQQEFEHIMKKYRRAWQPSQWPVTGFFSRLPHLIKDPFINYFFRFPTLVLALTLITIFSETKFIITSSVILLLGGLWIEAAHIIINRLTMGYMDSMFSRTISVRLLPFPEPQPAELFPIRPQILRQFAKLFVGLLILVIVGYVGIYTGLNKIYKPAFNNINEGWKSSLDLLYFTIVTLATVGYGDVTPKNEALLVRLAVASEIMLGFLLVVFLLTSFSLTLEPNESE